MTAQSLVTLERRADVAVVTLNRPAKRNALNVELTEALLATTRQLAGESGLAAVVLTGAGGAFSAGGDLKDERLFGRGETTERRLHYAQLGTEAARAWEALPQLTVAAVEGFAIGGGLTLALASDFRVLGRGAFLHVPEVTLGANYGWQSVPRLVSLIGPARTKRLVVLAERLPAARAETWGLADEVVEDGEALPAALRLAQAIARQPRLPAQITKRAVNAVARVFDNVSSHADMLQVLACIGTEPGEGALRG